MKTDNTLAFNFDGADHQPGFRLHRLEVYNWGTFHGKIWTFDLDGKNSFLTGETGSGKSTLVDAIASLLIQPKSLKFNKASGIDKKERDIKSYVMGTYGKTKDFESGIKNFKNLRDENSYSVIMGVFKNEVLGETLTLAQLFYINNGKVDRFYITSPNQMSIEKDFTNFGSDINHLKIRLREGKEVKTTDSFIKYEESFRLILGIIQDQALALFNQVISLKDVGDINTFVKTYMIEMDQSIDAGIEVLIKSFQDANKSHELLETIKDQIEKLTPVKLENQKRQEFNNEARHLNSLYQLIGVHFASIQYKHAEEYLISHGNNLSLLTAELSSEKKSLSALKKDYENVLSAISGNDGRRIDELDRSIQSLQGKKEVIEKSSNVYKTLATRLGLNMPVNKKEFDQSLSEILIKTKGHDQLVSELYRNEAQIENEVSEGKINQQNLNTQINSLRQNKGNISHNLIESRSMICKALQLDVADIPFAGELIRVKDDQMEWELAAEGVLGGFAKNMLVPEKYQKEFTQHVNANNMRGLIHFNIVRRSVPAFASAHPDSIASKVEVKTNSIFDNYIHHEINSHFDYVCCNLNDFNDKTYDRAVTSSGLKRNGDKNIKDDRSFALDKSNFVLGWSNEVKIASLEKALTLVSQILLEKNAEKTKINLAIQSSNENKSALVALAHVEDFSQINSSNLTMEIQEIIDERASLLSASDVLSELSKKKELAEVKINESELVIEGVNRKIILEEVGIESFKNQMNNAEIVIQSSSNEEYLLVKDDLSNFVETNFGEYTPENSHQTQISAMNKLEVIINASKEKKHTVEKNIVRYLGIYKSAHELSSLDFDASVESVEQALAILNQLEIEGIHNEEARFKKLLNSTVITNTIFFSTTLRQQSEKIVTKVSNINSALDTIRYQKERKLILSAEVVNDPAVRKFKDDLKECTKSNLEENMVDEEVYLNNKFLQIKSILERLIGRKEYANADRDWRNKVTDVRNWFEFSASEINEDGSQYQYYDDSNGKSGGQKEKLASSILAAGIYYQFQLDGSTDRNFRFFMVDEAFSKGSNLTTEFVFELFASIGIQFMVITPIAKVEVIENYVENVGLVSNNEETGCSSIMTMKSGELIQIKANAEMQREALADGQDELINAAQMAQLMQISKANGRKL